MRNILKQFFAALMILIVFDIMILSFSLAQIRFEERTGNWVPFWRVQAEFVLKIIN